MTWKDRFWGREDRIEPVKTAVIGEGPEAERLAKVYAAAEGIELVAGSPYPLLGADEGIRTPGLMAAEIVAPAEKRAELAADCLRAGLFTSVEPPPTAEALKELSWLARAYQVPLRFRLLPLYYPIYQEVKRLLNDDVAGRPMTLKLMLRRGKGSEMPADHDQARWLIEHELGFLALAPWLIGPVAKVYAKMHKTAAAGGPASALLLWKYRAIHQMGYLQMDFCPELHVRTFTDPVHRSLEVTGVGGLVIATRGEGQLLRQPALIVRGKTTTTAFEMIEDDWRAVYPNLASEIARVFACPKTPLRGHPDLALAALHLALAAQKSREQGEEVKIAN